MISGKKIYFIAIAGTGMSALAGLFKQRGYEVAGSDLACFPPVSDLLRDLKIDVNIGYDLEHLKSFKPDYVVIGNFVRRDNQQAIYVLQNKIPYGSLPSTLEDLFLKDTENFVVVGTHGKSTTTSCLAHLFQECGLKPGFLIGAIPFNFKRSFEVGGGKYFLLEGDEYDTAFFDKESKFLHYRPKWGIWTSLEFDHADIFPSMERLELMFSKFLEKIPSEGGLIYCRDWERIHELASDFEGRKISYGFHEESDWRIEDFNENSTELRFRLRDVEFMHSMTGRFNALNFTAALLAALQVPRIELKQLAQALKSFGGLKRRQEVRIEKEGRRVIDDFAHHPTAVKEVISSIKQRFPEDPVAVFFEARSNTSRRSFFQKEFTDALGEADYIYLPEVFKKEQLSASESLNIAQIIIDLKSRGKTADGPLELEELQAKAVQLIKKGPVSLLILSNGSFEGLHQILISEVERI